MKKKNEITKQEVDFLYDVSIIFCIEVAGMLGLGMIIGVI